MKKGATLWNCFWEGKEEGSISLDLLVCASTGISTTNRTQIPTSLAIAKSNGKSYTISNLRFHASTLGATAHGSTLYTMHTYMTI
jgi:hypothetical protein